MKISGINFDDKVIWVVPLTLKRDQHSARNLFERGAEPHSGQLRMAQGSTCTECIRRRSKLITACAYVNQVYIKGCCINCDYITLALELPRK